MDTSTDGRTWRVAADRSAGAGTAQVRSDASSRVATETGTPIVDLTARSRTLVESLGESASAELFLRQATDGVTDNTHFSTYGADRMARLVLDGVREARLAVLPYLRQP